MRVSWRAVRNTLQRAWWWLRQTSGDAAYELYLQSVTSPRSPQGRGSPGAPILSREEFYLDAVRRKYSGVSRCC